MPSVVICPTPILQFTNNDGTLLSGGSVLTQVSGVNAPTYSDFAGTILLPNPIPLNSRGEVSTSTGASAQLFLPANTVYTFTLFDALGNQIEVSPYVNGTSVTTASLAPLLGLAQTPGEIALGVIPSNLAYPPGNPWRYGADGLGGANDTNALATARTVVSTPGVNGWQNGVPNGVFLRTAAEIAAAVIPTDFSRSTEPYDIRRYGAKVDGLTDDTAAWRTALLVASQTIDITALAPNGALGSAITMPTGVSLVSSMIFLPNRVRVLGQNGLGSIVRANPNGWAVGNGSAPWSATTNYVMGSLVTNSGTLYIASQPNINQSPPSATGIGGTLIWNPISAAMFYAQNGYINGVGTSMFYSTLENLVVDCNTVGGLGCVLSSAWQEGCGLRSVLLYNFTSYGIRLQDGFGGAALAKIVDCNIFGGNVSNAIGIDLSSAQGSSGAFMLDVSNTTITGFAGGINLAAGISSTGNSVLCRSVHFEDCVSAVLLDGIGFHSMDDLTGGPAVTDLVHLNATYTGNLVMRNCRRLSATNYLNDARSGGYGALTSPDFPLFVVYAASRGASARGLAFASAWCVFNGTTTGTNPPLAGFNVTSVTRNSAGSYTIVMTLPMLSLNAAAVASSNLTSSGTSIGTSLSSTASFAVNISVSGTPTDASEVKAVIFGG